MFTRTHVSSFAVKLARSLILVVLQLSLLYR